MGIIEIIFTVVGGIILLVNAYFLSVAVDVPNSLAILALALIAGFDFGVATVVILLRWARRDD